MSRSTGRFRSGTEDDGHVLTETARPRACTGCYLRRVARFCAALSVSLSLAVPVVAEPPEGPGGAPEPSQFARDLYDFGCGPISVYIAAKKLGEDVPLRVLLDRSWQGTPHRLNLKEMCGLVDSIEGLEAEGVRMSPEDLAKFSQCAGSAVILVVRKYGADDASHAIVLDTCDLKTVTLLDYPEGKYSLDMPALIDAFDGQAVLVTKRHKEAQRESSPGEGLPCAKEPQEPLAEDGEGVE